MQTILKHRRIVSAALILAVTFSALGLTTQSAFALSAPNCDSYVLNADQGTRTIARSGCETASDNATFKETGNNTNKFVYSTSYKSGNSTKSCVQTISLLSGNATASTLSGSVVTGGKCKSFSSSQITVDTSAANPSGTGEGDSCNVGANPISWILCPIYDGLGSLSDTILGFLQKHFLETNPIPTSASDPIYQIWSSFRVWGDILLVIALLIVVFGQSIMGGIIDAYTAKKILPRLLVSAVLINLSIYLVALAVDVTNVIGGGVASVINAPLHGVSLSPSGWKLGVFAALPVGATIAATTSIVGLLAWAGALGGAAMIASQALPFLLIVAIVPILMSIVAIFLSLVFRQAIIMALVLISPIAFALYCIPNTEQYFRKWWSLLFNMLMVYPIIMVIFSVANVLAYTSIIASEKTTDLASTGRTSVGNPGFWAYFVALLLQFLPLLLIPYAFKLAGGVLGRIHEIATGAGRRAHQAVLGSEHDPYSLRNRLKYKARSGYTRGRGAMYDGLSEKSSMAGSGRAGRRIASATARGLGYGNLEYERALLNEEQEKVIAAQYSSGGDNTVRAYWAKQYTGDPSEGDAGNRKIGGWYTYADASGKYKEYSAADVAKAHSIIGNDMSRFQSYAKYEIGKAADDDQLDQFKDRFLELGQQNGYSLGEMKGIWAGDKFAHQHSRKEQKYQDVTQNKSTGKYEFTGVDHAGLSRELVDSVRKGEFASYRPSTGISVKKGLEEAHARLNGVNGFDYESASNKDENGKAKYNRALDEATYQNYMALATYLEPSLFGDPNRQAVAAQRAKAMAEASGEGQDELGFGLGASQRGEAAWKDFVQTARRMRPPREGNGRGGSNGGGPGNNGGGSGSSGGGNIITPGSSGFNIPPGSLPSGR